MTLDMTVPENCEALALEAILSCVRNSEPLSFCVLCE